MKIILFVIGFFIIAGSAGACDLEQITLAQAVSQSLVGIPLLAIGAS